MQNQVLFCWGRRRSQLSSAAVHTIGFTADSKGEAFQTLKVKHFGSIVPIGNGYLHQPTYFIGG